MSRRTALQTATAVGFASLGVFSAAREAYADGYDIWTGECPSYASEHDCSPGCGPSIVHAASCETSGEHKGFHKNDGVTWTLRPNQCYSGTYDGWLWRFTGACGACACGIERRCHDGYINSGSGWVRSICRWTTDCGCEGTVAWPTVRSGARGPDVHAAQHLVSHHGFATDPDGIFGPATQTAVQEFQTSVGLEATGVVNAQTWPRLVVTVRSGDSGDRGRRCARRSGSSSSTATRSPWTVSSGRVPTRRPARSSARPGSPWTASSGSRPGGRCSAGRGERSPAGSCPLPVARPADGPGGAGARAGLRHGRGRLVRARTHLGDHRRARRLLALRLRLNA